MAESATYQLTQIQALTLAAAFVMKAPERRQFLEEYVAGAGSDALVDLLTQFIGLANATEENARGFIECMLMAHGDYTERGARDANAPSILGAIEGSQLARTPTKGMCDSCAFRLGTVPNQCLPTVTDAKYALGGPMQFMCHYDVDEYDEPVALCAGFAAARAELQASTGSE